MRIAIIGAGPSGFFVAGEILKRCPDSEVHLFEKRVAPYGLARFGVTPDHPLTRRVTKLFDQIASHDRFHYLGNVEVGRDVRRTDLFSSYHAVVLCTGAEIPIRPELPGSERIGAVNALDLARWANGEPEAFSDKQLEGVHTAIIIGNGNVALDAARMLARPSVDWVATDIAPYAMEVLMHHRIKHIVIVGRRGPEHASFTEAEMEEVVDLPDWAIASSEALPFGISRNKPKTGKTIEFLFHLQAASLQGSERVTGARFVHSQTGETVDIPAQLVVFATGHRGVRLEDLPFDEQRGVIPNNRGAVIGVPGFYVCGWIKRGAKGLIGQNRKDAIETVVRLIEDRDTLSARQIKPRDWATELADQGKRIISWADWKKLDAMEVQRGSAVGRPRINFTCKESLDVLSNRR